MKLTAALLLSLLLHTWMVQATSEQVDQREDERGSAGQAALFIGDIHFQATVDERPDNKAPQETQVEPQPDIKIEPATKPRPKVIPIADTAEQKAPALSAATAPAEDPTAVEEARKVFAAQQPAPSEVITTTDIESEHAGFDQVPVMEQPNYRKAFPPHYPRLALKRGYQGVVMVRAKVGIDGWVKTVELLVSSGHENLDQSALSTVAQWQFHPYQVDEKLTVAWVEIPVEFTLAR
mgnify:CR=1 FL=1